MSSFLSNRLNRYDFYIILIISLLIFGQSDSFRGFLPIRLVGYFFIPLMIKNKKNVLTSPFLKKWWYLFIFWFVYCIVSMAWNPNPLSVCLPQFFHVGSLMITFWTLCFCTSLAKEPVLSISLGWTTLVAMSLPIAFWEFIEQKHLDSGMFSEGHNYGAQHVRIYAAVTFQNLNSYVVVLCSALPFVVAIFFLKKIPFWLTFINTVVIIGTTVVLVLNASRGGLLTAGLLFFFFYLFQMRHSSLVKKMVLMIPLIFVLAIIINQRDTIVIFEQLLYRLSNESMIEDNSRFEIYKQCLYLALNGGFLGGGVYSMTLLFKSLPECRVPFAHNMFLELLLEYGLMITLLFIFLYYKSIFHLRTSKYIYIKFLFYYLLTSVALFVIDDSYFTRSVIWVYIASIVSVVNYKMKLQS